MPTVAKPIDFCRARFTGTAIAAVLTILFCLAILVNIALVSSASAADATKPKEPDRGWPYSESALA